MRTPRNVEWTCDELPNGQYTHADAELSVLMDIREELQTLNRVLRCPNFLAIPRTLEAIRKNTVKPKKRKVKK